LKRYIAQLIECSGGIPQISDNEGKPVVKIIAIKGEDND